jgi:hypothetical protein
MPREIMEEIIILEEQRAQDWTNRNIEGLKNLMDEDFLEINFFGRFSRPQILDDVFPRLTLHEFDMRDHQLLKVGEDVAILTYQVFELINFQGELLSGDFHVAAMYKRKNQKWSLLLWQITPYTVEK